MKEFRRIDRLPPYVFNVVNDLKAAARRAGEDVVDLGMGNPDLASPEPVVDKLIRGGARPSEPPLFDQPGPPEPPPGDR